MIGPAASVLLTITVLGATPNDKPDPDRARCVENLKSIQRAFDAYYQDARVPSALSDLVPKYLADKSALRCPADRSAAGEPGDGGTPDPRPGVSYSYEIGSRLSGGMAIPPGRPPESDVEGKPWGTDRNVSRWLAQFYGVRVPIVRCLHHRDKGDPIALNLSMGGEFFQGGPDWRSDPEFVAAFARRAARDLAADPDRFSSTWSLPGISETARHWDRAAASEVGSKEMTNLAKTLLQQADKTADSADTQRIAARLLVQVRDFAAAEAAARALLARPDHAEDEEARHALATSLAGRGLYREAGAVYQQMMLKNPESKNVRAGLADTLDASGREAEARELMESIDPLFPLINRKAPVFHAPLLSGEDASITSAVEGKKALLVTFWFRRSQPCLAELSRLQKLHDELGGKGLAVLSINSEDEESTIATFVKTNGWTFPVVLGAKEREGRSIPEAYRVAILPTHYLIDPTGRVVYRHVGPDEAGLRKALKGLGVE